MQLLPQPWHPTLRSHCHPDVVIWKDLNTDEKPPENQIWPILWACELKYCSPDNGAGDVKKLINLILQGRIEFGCSIRVHFARDPHGIGINWQGTEHGRQLWICDVSMPEIKVEL
jgi:hypothetical protein